MDQGGDGIRLGRTCERRELESQTTLLHRHRGCERVKRASIEQELHHVRDGFRRDVVDVRGELHDPLHTQSVVVGVGLLPCEDTDHIGDTGE